MRCINIIGQIDNSQVIIAEITAQNENVFYEVGFAHALKKPTILLADRAKKLPFDVAGYRCILYENSIGGGGKRKIEDLLRKHLASITNE
jgi:nucleoside 2-deoxyribosyltransferase